MRVLRIKHKLIVPIYEAEVWVIVSDNIAKERENFNDLFGPFDGERFDAICTYSGGQTFALFFTPRALTYRVIAHEVFHLTHRILDWVGANFDSKHHETAALLHDYLFHNVCKIVKKINA